MSENIRIGIFPQRILFPAFINPILSVPFFFCRGQGKERGASFCKSEVSFREPNSKPTPTDPITILELQDLEIGEFYGRNSGTPLPRILKLQILSVGLYR